jgi:hypothetical protein
MRQLRIAPAPRLLERETQMRERRGRDHFCRAITWRGEPGAHPPAGYWRRP